MKIAYFLIISTLGVLLTGCYSAEEPGENGAGNDPKSGEQVDNSSLESQSEPFEQYVAKVNAAADSLTIANSLLFTKSDGSIFEVKLVLDDNNEIIRMIEAYSNSTSGSIQTKWFYFKNGNKYVTKEYFEEGTGDNAHFVERVSYYKKDGNVQVTKRRTATFEDHLEGELFSIVDNYNCSEDRSYRALQREGEFETNFKGFISDGSANYLIVGSDEEDGFGSSFLVQYYTPIIQNLMKNEASMMGTPLDVQFETVSESTGYSFQLLIAVTLRENK